MDLKTRLHLAGFLKFKGDWPQEDKEEKEKEKHG